MTTIKSPRKLIEVALPLDKINEAAAREKSIRHGHPSTLHLWWARRPLAAARAVIFAQMVNDPGYQQGGGFKYGKNKKEAAEERKRLFRIMEELVLWENIDNERLLEEARGEIRRSWIEICELNRDHPQAAELFNPNVLPGLHDPFAGGGSIPLEALRLGLEAYASDLNPVAVTINKAMIEVPPKFAGLAPIGPLPRGEQASVVGLSRDWPGATGLAEDVRRYGTWMRDRAVARVGHLYPPVEVTAEMAAERADLKPYVGKKLTVLAWIWARTVKSPNPAYSHVDVPLVSSFVISKKDGKEVYVEPLIEGDRYRFIVKIGVTTKEAESGTKLARGANFSCLLSGGPISPDHIKAEGCAGRMGQKLMAVILEGDRGKIYLSPTDEMEALAKSASPTWIPETPLPDDHRNFWTVAYGLTKFGDLFTPRQLVALTTFADLVPEAISQIRADALAAGMPDDGRSLDDGGCGATAYAQGIGVYLGLGLGRSANYWSSLTPWGGDFIVQTFGRQAIPMVWDFAEGNPLSNSTGNWTGALEWIEKVITTSLDTRQTPFTSARQCDAQTQTLSFNKVISTDPPYYDNIGYADLSDYFYVWLRKCLRPIFPNLYATVSVPKVEELVALPYRHGGKKLAEAFFLEGMTRAMSNLSAQAHPAFPVTIYYAFKQSNTKDAEGTHSTGWETFLEALLSAGFVLTGTWPVRAERDQGLKTGTNVLASCIVLVCQKRSVEAPNISRREFVRELNVVLPEALDEMTKGIAEGRSPVAPVDLSQAIIGPGMAVFSKYTAVLEADGSPMSVKTALQLINRFLAEDDFDADTQWCLHWFEQYGWKVGEFGQADVLARAKATSVEGLAQAGVVEAGGGSVRLYKWAEYPTDWDPRTDSRLPIWEALHHLIRTLKQGGETAAGAVVIAIPGKVEAVRQLAYRLYTLCERQGWAEDARAYNELITSWSGIESAASNVQPAQRGLFD